MLQLGLCGPVPLASLHVLLTAKKLELASGDGSFCVLVRVIPQVYIYNGAEGREHLLTDRDVSRNKRVASDILIILLTGTGIT